MSRFTWAGIIAWLASLALYVFQTVSKVIEKGAYGKTSQWDDVSLFALSDPGRFAWVDQISWVYLNKAVDFIVHAQIYTLVFCIGILFFIVGMFRPD